MSSLTSIQMLAFSKTCDVTQALLIVLDSKFLIKYINRYAKKTLNWKEKKEVIGQPFSKIWQHSGFPPLLDSKGKLLIDEPMTIQSHLIQWQQLTGVMHGENGLLLVGQDITKTHKLRLHIRDLNNELKMQKSKQELENQIVANLSHEITGQNIQESLSPYQCLTQVRDYLENIIAKMPCFVYWKDLSLRYLGCNDMALIELGLKSKDDFVGKTDYDFGWDARLVENYRKIDEEIIATGRPKLNMVDTIIDGTGNNRRLLSNKMPLFDKNKKIIGIVGISIDITQRIETEEKLNVHIQELVSNVDEKKTEKEKVYQSLKNISREITGQIFDKHLAPDQYVNRIRNYYENIIEKMPCYVFWKDRDLKYLGCNNLIAQSLNLKKSRDIIGKTDEDFAWDRQRVEEFKRTDKKIIETGQPILGVEDTVTDNEGKELYLLVNKMPLFSDMGKVIGIVGISIDITERKRMEMALEISKAAAEKANKAKSEFIENISHDIKTPLSGVIGMAELLTLKLDDEKFKEYAETIKKSASQLLDLFNEVLDIMNKDVIEKPENIDFDLKELAHDIVNFLKPTIREKNIQFKFLYSDKIKNHCFGNRFHLYRVILNLVSNAIKFTDPNGKVTLAIILLNTDKKQQTIEVAVSDTGIGIPKKSQEMIFDRYTRLTPSYTGKYKGSGLGLYIVKKMVTEMGGSVSVDSEVGKGSTFRVILTLPLAKEIVTARKKSSSSKKNKKEDINPKLQLISVLLVEDNPIAQMMEKELLLSTGCQVDIAATGQEALEKFSSHAYSLVFMDIGLPDISGYKVTEKIRQYEKDKQHSPTLILGLNGTCAKTGSGSRNRVRYE